MDKFDIIIPTLFGLEAFCAKEIRCMGYETKSVEDGRVTFEGDIRAVCRANIGIRTGERVLIKAAEFEARSFEELFEGTRAFHWEEWIGAHCAFPVKGHCLKSQLASVRDCQAIIKKSIASRLGEKYRLERLPEDGPCYRVQFSIIKDRVTLMIDTSGEPLHKRGYRQLSNAAPLRETIAAAIVMMSYWKYEYPLADPMCGSGTIPIEAAMIKRNIAPGLSRSFAAQEFLQIPKALWQECAEEARGLERDIPLEIYAADIDPETVRLASDNAQKAGVGKWVRPVCADVRKMQMSEPYGTVICNPPYGERMGEKRECERLYGDMGRVFSRLDKWNYYILTSNEDFERLFGKRADKKRKLYNGMLKCGVYQYFGPKPPRKGEEK
ncbi:MAG: class I SAM-dependent RNA methyltransferase [Clostridiales bacterium]|nr:class I SAM-dependent RNA methyltransferase [Clostridiales bacterium]